MFNSPILDVAISLVFVYLLFSLMASAAKEMIAGVLNLRGRFLMKGIEQLLSDVKSTYSIKIPDGVTVAAQDALKTAFASATSTPQTKKVADWFLKDTQLSHLQGTWLLTKIVRTPSYISDHDFSAALLISVFDAPHIGQQLISDVKTYAAVIPDKGTRESLLKFLGQVDRGLPTLQQNIEKWYNDAMDRVSGWYKRNAQVVLVIISLLFAGFLNVDTIKLANRIYHDAPLRASIVASAAKPIARDTTNPQHDFELVKSQVDAVNLPLGWNSSLCQLWNRFDLRKSESWSKMFGLLLTVFALSLGAPFWFDMLNKVINVRSSGPKPANSSNQPDGGSKVITVFKPA